MVIVASTQLTAELELTKAHLAEARAQSRTNHSSVLDLEAKLKRDREDAASELKAVTDKFVRFHTSVPRLVTVENTCYFCRSSTLRGSVP